jgi:lysophospholipase L1-like esterase
MDTKLLAVVCLMSFVPAPQRITKVWLVGDSTMADKEVKAYPETGWGMPFENFFDSTVVVDNRAKNGRSTRTFFSEGRWAAVMQGIQGGDYVLIQFGHNDEVPSKIGSYTPLDDFKANLVRMVKETRDKGGIPVLLTPVARRAFDSAGRIRETHPVYAQAVREVAGSVQAPLIDLDAKSQAVLQQYGPEYSKSLFNYLDPNEHPNYPEGHKDDTHFNELGARKMAEIVLAEIRALHLGLADHIRPPLASKK